MIIYLAKNPGEITLEGNNIGRTAPRNGGTAHATAILY